MEVLRRPYGFQQAHMVREAKAMEHTAPLVFTLLMGIPFKGVFRKRVSPYGWTMALDL